MRQNKPIVDFRPAFFLGISFAIIIIPIRWIIAWLTAATIHELCHMAAIYLCGHRVERITFDISGARIATGTLSPKQEFICALAGPLSGFVLLFTARLLPELAVCGFTLSLCNLLPLYPLDGGRMLRGILTLFLSPGHSVRIQRITEYICITTLLIAGVYLSVTLLSGPLPIIVATVLCLRNKKIKFPCKVMPGRVQYMQLNQKRYHNERTTAAHFANCSEACPLHRRRIQ